jgi:alpha-galactosidase
MSGSFGYELDITTLSSQEKRKSKKQIEFYKKIEHKVHQEDFYRLISPFEENSGA